MFSGALQHSLWCGSAWFVVRIKYVDRALRRKKFRKKKASIPLYLLLPDATVSVAVCVLVLTLSK